MVGHRRGLDIMLQVEASPIRSVSNFSLTPTYTVSNVRLRKVFPCFSPLLDLSSLICPPFTTAVPNPNESVIHLGFPPLCPRRFSLSPRRLGFSLPSLSLCLTSVLIERLP